MAGRLAGGLVAILATAVLAATAVAADQTAIDRAFEALREDPAAADQFIDTLIASELVAPVEVADDPEFTGNVPDDRSFHFVTVEGPDGAVIPVFDTRRRLFAWAGAPVAFVVMEGRYMLPLIDPSLAIALNIGAPSALLLDGQRRRDVMSRIAGYRTGLKRLENEESFHLRPLQSTVAALRPALVRALGTRPGAVESAWLAEVSFDGPEGPFRPLAALVLTEGARRDAVLPAIMARLRASGAAPEDLVLMPFSRDDPALKTLQQMGEALE